MLSRRCRGGRADACGEGGWKKGWENGLYFVFFYQKGIWICWGLIFLKNLLRNIVVVSSTFFIFVSQFCRRLPLPGGMSFRSVVIPPVSAANVGNLVNQNQHSEPIKHKAQKADHNYKKIRFLIYCNDSFRRQEDCADLRYYSRLSNVLTNLSKPPASNILRQLPEAEKLFGISSGCVMPQRCGITPWPRDARVTESCHRHRWFHRKLTRINQDEIFFRWDDCLPWRVPSCVSGCRMLAALPSLFFQGASTNEHIGCALLTSPSEVPSPLSASALPAGCLATQDFDSIEDKLSGIRA